MPNDKNDNEAELFDKSRFKVTPCDIPPIIRDFFKQPTGNRNINTNLDEIQRHLSDIKPFSRLAIPLQNQILQEAWYECYSEERIIVRQGNRPACFYIILSGSATVTYKVKADSRVEILDVFTRGCTFGETGILSNTQQRFTVTSKTKLELLVLWKDDFKAIYMSDDRHCSADDLKFLKNNVPFLRGFSVDSLNEFPHAIQHCNYRQSEVIAEDSRRIRHIFVVKSGSLDIWKRLEPDGYVPRLGKYDLDQLKNEKMVDDNDGMVHEATANDHALFSEVQLSSELNESNGPGIEADTRLNRSRHEKDFDDGKLARSIAITNFEKKFPGIADKRDRLHLINYDQISLYKASNELESSLNSGITKCSRPMKSTKPKLIFPSQVSYIRIKKLSVGQHFGLSDMLFPNQAALTLISNKCECLLLLKSSFVRIASDHYKQNIRRTEIPFPSDIDLYKLYHNNELWRRYSREVYDHVCEKMSHHRRHLLKSWAKSSTT